LRASLPWQPENERNPLSTLVEKYEDEHYPIEPSPPHMILQHLMEARGLKQKDITHLFGSSGRASEAINGLRPISVFLWWAGVRSKKKCEWADESSQSIASCGNGWSKYLSFQMKR